MKKKIKDLTIEELIKYCSIIADEDCNNCPFCNLCDRSYWEYPRLEDLNKEVEINE